MSQEKGIVCWTILSSGLPIFSAPLHAKEALMVYHHGPQKGTTYPRIYWEGSQEYARALK